MDQLYEFVELLTGHFNNRRQKDELEQAGEHTFPYAEHVNTVCNQKITGLPHHFQGVFLLEESYYTTEQGTHASNHLFLFTQEQDGILLTSYEVPEGYDKASFSYEQLTTVPFDRLKPSVKFTPALYRKKGDAWEGGSVSMFTPALKFTLFERFTQDTLEVSESMELNGKRTFGYDRPILYRR